MAGETDRYLKDVMAFVALLVAKYNIHSVVVFGSAARGEAREDSDIDVAVFSEEFGNDPVMEMTDLFRLRRRVNPALEPIPFSRDAYDHHGAADFVARVLTEGIEVYKAGGSQGSVTQ